MPIAVIVILILAAVVRLTGLTARELWYDELQSVTHAYLPLEELLVSVQRFDPHPPLYYIQLHLWLLSGVSNLWIKLNSVLWSLLAIVSLFVVSKSIFDDRTGLVASLLLSIFPFSVAYAQEVRMYSLIMFLGIWTLFFAHHFLYGNKTFLMGVGLIVSILAFLYSHGAGFMILVSAWSYALMYLLEAKAGLEYKGRRVVQFFGLQLIVLLLYIPWLYQAQTIHLGHTVRPDWEAIGTTLSILLLGFGSLPRWLSWGGVALAFGIIAILLVRDKSSRSLIVSFVVAPIIICILISYLNRPIWLYRTLAYIVPFLSLAIALAIIRSFESTSIKRARTLIPYGFFALVSGVLIVALVNQQLTYSYPWHIRAAAEFIRQEAQPGDSVYVPHERIFWGFAWYFVGPGSVDPLTTSYSLESHAIRVYSRPAAQDQVIGRGCEWLVYRDIDDTAPFELSSQHERASFGGLTVAKLCSPSASGLPDTNLDGIHGALRQPTQEVAWSNH